MSIIYGAVQINKMKIPVQSKGCQKMYVWNHLFPIDSIECYFNIETLKY